MTEQRPSETVYDARALAPDAQAVEALARLQLEARRCGQRTRVCGASSELQELLAFCGLSFVLGPVANVAGRSEVDRERDV
jgi:hypothetical protein